MRLLISKEFMTKRGYKSYCRKSGRKVFMKPVKMKPETNTQFYRRLKIDAFSPTAEKRYQAWRKTVHDDYDSYVEPSVHKTIRRYYFNWGMRPDTIARKFNMTRSQSVTGNYLDEAAIRKICGKAMAEQWG